MRRLLVIVALVFAHTGLAGDFEDGMAALERKDFATAFSKFRSAAQQGNAAAQTNLGVMYDRGEGVAQDYTAAVHWYRLAAKQGIAIAQYNLGLNYENGRGVTQDYKEAARFYRLAAESGLEVAQHAIASLYLRGDGVTKSNLLAYMWSYLASERGNIESKNLNHLAAANMTLKQAEQAQRMARECMASNFRKCN
jgi:TPR repeat protein